MGSNDDSKGYLSVFGCVVFVRVPVEGAVGRAWREGAMTTLLVDLPPRGEEMDVEALLLNEAGL